MTRSYVMWLMVGNASSHVMWLLAGDASHVEHHEGMLVQDADRPAVGVSYQEDTGEDLGIIQ